MSGDPHLDAARPLVNQAVDAYLKQLVVLKGPGKIQINTFKLKQFIFWGKIPMRHDHAVVELVVGPPPLSGAVVVAQLHQGALPFVEADFVVVETKRTTYCFPKKY